RRQREVLQGLGRWRCKVSVDVENDIGGVADVNANRSRSAGGNNCSIGFYPAVAGIERRNVWLGLSGRPDCEISQISISGRNGYVQRIRHRGEGNIAAGLWNGEAAGLAGCHYRTAEGAGS